jgi:hypothetical protein
MAIEAGQGCQRSALDLDDRDPQPGRMEDELFEGAASLRNDDQAVCGPTRCERLFDRAPTRDELLTGAEQVRRGERWPGPRPRTGFGPLRRPRRAAGGRPAPVLTRSRAGLAVRAAIPRAVCASRTRRSSRAASSAGVARLARIPLVTARWPVLIGALASLRPTERPGRLSPCERISRLEVAGMRPARTTLTVAHAFTRLSRARLARTGPSEPIERAVRRAVATRSSRTLTAGFWRSVKTRSGGEPVGSFL